MTIGDIAAIGILFLSVLFGLRGYLRWIPRLFIGLVVGCLILGIIGIAGRSPWLGRVGTFFQTGTITPYMGSQLERIANRIGIEVVNDPNGKRASRGRKDAVAGRSDGH